MSLIDLSAIRCETLFLKAFVAWISGDLATTQLLCFHCLNHLRFNPEFTHVAFCLYVFAFCVREGTKEACAYRVIEILKETRDVQSIKIISPWENLFSFDGTKKSFLLLVRKSYLSSDLVQNESEANKPPWCPGLSVDNLEDLASFCLDYELPELGLDFAIKAHVQSLSLKYSNCNGFSSPVNQVPCVSLQLAEKLGMQLYDATEVYTDKSDVSYDSQNEHAIFKSMFDSSSTTETSTTTTIQRRPTRCSILKSPSLCDSFARNGISGDSLLKSEKRVRFSLSDMHPPPHLEAEYGGRNNDKRYSDLLRRRNSNRECSFYQVDGFDRFISLFWPLEHCSLSRRLIDLLTILIFIALIVIFTLLFFSLIFCVPLAWLSAPGNLSPNSLPIYTEVCFRLLDCFYLRSLIA